MSRAKRKPGIAGLGRGGESWPEGKWNKGFRIVLATLLAGVVFAVDTFTTLAGAVAVLYCLVLLVAGEGRPRSAVFWSTGGTLALAFGSFIANHGLSLDAAPDFRFLFSIAAILTTGFLLLRQAETRRLHRLQSRLLEVTADAIILRSPDGEVLLWNHGAEALYGWPRDAMVGSLHHEVLCSRFSSPTPVDVMHDTGQGQWFGEVEQRCKDGRLVTVSSRWQVMRTPTGDPWAILETSTDITARREAERKLERSERRYRNIFETLAVAVLEYDFTAIEAHIRCLRGSGVTDIVAHYRADSTLLEPLRASICVINANETAVRLFGEPSRASFISRYRRYLPYSNQDFLRCLVALDGRAARFEAVARSANARGEPLSLIVAMTFPPDGDGLDCVQVSITDLTDNERMADEMTRMRADLDQAMRAATIGEISAIIAHEVNQPLAAVKTYMDAARRWLGHEPANVAEATAVLRDANEAVSRAGQVVKNVRKVFNRGSSDSLPVVIDAMIGDTVRLAARDIGDHATQLRLELNAGDATVTASRVMLQQSLLSLMVNALQAMKSMPEAERLLSIRSGVADRTVWVMVQDTGPGFPPEIVERATDAFFSTGSGGMGIGLAVCRSTILSVGGTIAFANRTSGTGAVVTLVLPASD